MESKAYISTAIHMLSCLCLAFMFDVFFPFDTLASVMADLTSIMM